MLASARSASTRSSSAAHGAYVSAPGTPYTASWCCASSRFSRTDCDLARPISWNVRPIPSRARASGATSWIGSSAEPDRARVRRRTKPETALNSVLLPAPFGPDQPDDRALGDLDRDAVEGLQARRTGRSRPRPRAAGRPPATGLAAAPSGRAEPREPRDDGLLVLRRRPRGAFASRRSRASRNTCANPPGCRAITSISRSGADQLVPAVQEPEDPRQDREPERGDHHADAAPQPAHHHHDDQRAGRAST